MPSNPTEEFRWVSIDRGVSHEKILKNARDSLCSISFDEDNHPLGKKNVSISNVSSKLNSKGQNNLGKSKNVPKKEPTKKTSTFIDPLSAMSAKSDEDIDDVTDDLSETSAMDTLQASLKRY